jgi:D-psicose/D-tagatose/L-ribulose 3-epimerase
VKLAISNIAWPVERDADVARLLSRRGVTGIEIAPTKIWQCPLQATLADIRAYRSKWLGWDIAIVAAQALLFGQPGLTIFDNAKKRRETARYLDEMIRLCAELGAEALVFGSPKNRLVGSLDRDSARRVAIDFFTSLGETAQRCGTKLVIEANPEAYGADFLTHADETIGFVRDVNHPAIRLHLDTGCMTLSNDRAEEAIAAGLPYLRHFHISEPNLAAIGERGVDHDSFANALRTHGYKYWASIEMKQQDPFSIENIELSLSATQCYC